MEISGPIIRATVSQVFTNHTDVWVEGVYIFPLPNMAAVDHLKMVVGGRLIEGQIEEKKKAKAIYEKAKSEGKKASLLTQERPNIFTNSVANIGPGESVAIQIEYQDMALMEDGVFSMRFPMTVGPRFSPPAETIQVASRDGNVMAVLDPVLDRDRIRPRVMPPSFEPVEYTRLPVSIEIDLDPGFPIMSIVSPYHDIHTVGLDGNFQKISLSEGEVPANRDFLLEWTAQPSDKPYTAIYHQTKNGEDFVMTMVTPAASQGLGDTKTHPRETVFIIDTSGSMGGTSISQARDALILGLDRLGPDDLFNIIEFNNSHSSLYSAPRKATPDNIASGKSFVSKLSAGGGTMMGPALETALSTMRRPNSHLGQIIFITDGNIGNETQLFAIIKDQLGDARLFPVAIGSAPNNFFMSRSAKFGRGKFVNVGDTSEVYDRMDELFDDIDSAILTNLSLNGLEDSEQYPSRIPDLYDGQPVVTVSRVAELPVQLTLSGRLADRNWQMPVTRSDLKAGSGLDVLWARRKIADLEENRFSRSTASQIDQQILDTALKYHLVSRLTSMVAVDVTPSRPISENLSAQNVPTMLPNGWDFALVAGTNIADAKPQPVMSPHAARQKILPVPGTASPHNFLMLLGAGFMSMALLLRRRFGWAA